MPKSFTQITDEWGGAVAFRSSQDDILEFLAGPLLTDWGGMCFALVIMWLDQDSFKIAPNKGVVNKVKANRLQTEMEGSWLGLPTATTFAQTFLSGKTFWWVADDLIPFKDWKGPGPYLMNDPREGREGLHILVLYFNEGPAHAIGVVRAPTGTMAIYDPNHGAGILPAERFEGYLANFVYELYPDVKGFAIISFTS
jgi:hypothetical protein